jgi:hypothetical protein
MVRAVVLAISAPEAPAPAAESSEASAAEATVEAEPAARPSNDSFSALLGTVAAVLATDELLPSAPVPAQDAPTAPAAAPELVAVPLAVSVDPGVRAAPRRTRAARSDPFARTTTRRERILTRICMGLALTLALAVIVLRLPLGSRPGLGASSSATTGVNTPVSSSPTTSTVFDAAIREQTQADLQVVVATALRLFPVWKSFAPETPLTLNRAAPQFGFVSRSLPSRRVGELSVSGSARTIVLAEFAGPDHCAFARVTYGHQAEIITPVRAACSALAAPQHGWAVLSS